MLNHFKLMTRRKEKFNLSCIIDIVNNFDGPQRHYTE